MDKKEKTAPSFRAGMPDSAARMRKANLNRPNKKIAPSFRASKPDNKEQTFKAAFAENRSAGKKEFTWEGKRYNTNVKAEAPKAFKASTPTPKADTPTPKADTPTPKADTFPDFTVKAKDRPKPKAEAEEPKTPAKVEKEYTLQKKAQRAFLPGQTSYKKDGSVRGNGCAIRGKTKGRMV